MTILTDQQESVLLDAALKAKKMAYLIKGNHYQVGAALITKSGKIYTGCNIENEAHTPSVCAERVALFKAYSEGDRDIIAMIVVTDDGGACCGVCRQVMADLAPNIKIILSDVNQTKKVVTSLNELLPMRWNNPSLVVD